MLQEKTSVGDPLTEVFAPRLTLFDTASFSVEAIGVEPHRWIRFVAIGTVGRSE